MPIPLVGMQLSPCFEKGASNALRYAIPPMGSIGKILGVLQPWAIACMSSLGEITPGKRGISMSREHSQFSSLHP